MATKPNKARDIHGHVYEVFKNGGRDLKLSLLKMFNLTRRFQEYPDILQLSSIKSIYKLKGRKDDLNNDRGVFNVVKIRSLLDKLIYNDKYELKDKQMSKYWRKKEEKCKRSSICDQWYIERCNSE